jgi:hypothetical protein
MGQAASSLETLAEELEAGFIKAVTPALKAYHLALISND